MVEHSVYDKPMYCGLLDIVARRGGKEHKLDLNVHRYKAVANGTCVGYFSTLDCASSAVDEVYWQGRKFGVWAESGANNITFVLDTVSKRTYARVAAEGAPAVRVEVMAGDEHDGEDDRPDLE